ncbi:MAG TPA: acyl-homoserine-lactone synthase [Afifellaceae bacterium]|nr:acyl-homoserine-lactone synthase [Afifellaceae bacterium]
MIIRVEPKEREKYKLYLSDMFKLRASVFHDELRWNVEVHDRKEYDAYDAEENVYLLSVNQQRVLDGALRLMPTSGPTRLTHLFTELVPSDMALRSPLLWEASRFCVCHTHSPLHRGIAISAWHLVIAAVELGIEIGIDALVIIYDERLKRLCRIMGVRVEDLSFRSDENGTVYFGLIETTPETVQRIRDKGEIFEDIAAMRLDSLAA